MTSQWARWRLKSPALPMFSEPFIQAQIREKHQIRSERKTSKLRVTGLCARNCPVPDEFPAQMASNAENVSIWWHHHDMVRGNCSGRTWLLLTTGLSHGPLWVFWRKMPSDNGTSLCCKNFASKCPLQWCHNECDGVSNNRRFDCMLTRLFRRTPKKTSNIPVTGIFQGTQRWLMDSPHEGPVTRKIFPIDDVIMVEFIKERSQCNEANPALMGLVPTWITLWNDTKLYNSREVF